MIFVYKYWEKFLKDLKNIGITSIPAKDVSKHLKTYLVLKHDVETDVKKAYEFAKLEKEYGHRGSYYVQAYLLNDEENVALLALMRDMGHEISYHYDVMDSNKGDIDKAMHEFESNKQLFEKNGFELCTVCQHGNPIVERVGYTSNRDFFRNEKVRETYSPICDIMVNYKEQYHTEYQYVSDAGRQFKLIYDPINNDVVNSDNKNIPFSNLNELIAGLSQDGGNIISVHPHRWTRSAITYIVKTTIFKVVKAFAKALIKIPLLKKIFSKYYFIAKKM